MAQESMVFEGKGLPTVMPYRGIPVEVVVPMTVLILVEDLEPGSLCPGLRVLWRRKDEVDFLMESLEVQLHVVQPFRSYQVDMAQC